MNRLIAILLLIATPLTAAEPVRDRDGVPLPEGAIARIGKQSRYERPVKSVAWSPDGKWLATVSSRRVVVSEWPSGRQRFEQPLDWSDDSVSFSADASLLLRSHYVRLDRIVDGWGTPSEVYSASGKRVAQIPPGPFVLSPDGRRVAIGGADVRIRNLTGDPDEITYRVEGFLLTPVVFTDKQLFAVTYDEDEKLTLYNLLTGQLIARIECHPDFRLLSRSVDGSRIALPHDQGVVVIDTATGKHRLLKSDDGQPRIPSLSADGQTLAMDNGKTSVVVWDLAKDEPRCRLDTAETPEGSKQQVFLSPDGKLAVVTKPRLHDIHAMLLWDTTTGKRLIDRTSPITRITDLAWSPDGRTLATATGHWPEERDVWLWDADTGSLERTLEAHREGTSSVRFSPDGTRLATAGLRDGAVRLWDARTGELLRQRNGHERYALHASFSEDGQDLLCATSALIFDGSTRWATRWNVRTDLSRQLAPSSGGSGWPSNLTLVPGGRQVILAGQRYDLGTGRKIESTDELGTAFLATDSRFARGQWQSVFRPWGLATEQRLALSPGGRALESLAFSPDGRTAALAGNGRILLVDWVAGRDLGPILQTTGTVDRLAFSPDSKRLATVSESETSVLIWRVPTERKAPAVTATEVALWFDGIEPRDAVFAHRAVHHLASVPDESVPLIREALPPVARPDAVRVKQLLADLASPTAATRERARAALEKLGDAIEDDLSAALSTAKEDARQPLTRLLRRVSDEAAAPLRVRQSRMVAVLEYARTPEARRLLAELADGAPQASLTREAKAALSRCRVINGE